MTFSRSIYGASFCLNNKFGTILQGHLRTLSDYSRSYISTFILLRSSSVNCVDIYDPQNIPASVQIPLSNRPLACALIHPRQPRAMYLSAHTFQKHKTHPRLSANCLGCVGIGSLVCG